MNIFNIVYFSILSKEKNERNPFYIGVPFTEKTKNIFFTLVYVYDNLRRNETIYPNLYSEKIKFNEIIQLYYFPERKTSQ